MQIEQLALAKIQGKEIKEFPKDLYIPPDAMLVILEMFEGPLDLLLYMIRKNNLDILDIPVASITKQYVEYVEFMHLANLELTSDYLEMAAILAEIKSRMLLPVLHTEEIEEDPRAELVRKLQEYEQIKQAAANLDIVSRQDRDYFVTKIPILLDSKCNKYYMQPEVKFEDLLSALKKILMQKDLIASHTIRNDNLSIRDKMTYILTMLKSLEYNFDKSIGQNTGLELGSKNNKFFLFTDLFNFKEGRLGIVVTFLAILELVKEELLEILQTDHFSPIYIRLTSND